MSVSEIYAIGDTSKTNCRKETKQNIQWLARNIGYRPVLNKRGGDLGYSESDKIWILVCL